MRKLTIIFLFLAVNVWFALGWTPPSPITPPNTVPDAVANMNMGIIAGSVPAGAPSGANCDSEVALAGNVAVESGTVNFATSGRWHARKMLAADTDAGTAGCVKVFVHEDNSDSDENIGVAIYANTGSGNTSFPTGSPIASGAFPSYNFTTAGDLAWHSFVMDATAELSDATDYWVALFCANSSIQIRQASNQDTYEGRYTGAGQAYNSPPDGSAFSSSFTDARTSIGIY